MNLRQFIRANAHRIAALMSVGKPFTFGCVRFYRRDNLNFDSDGRVSVPVSSILASPAFKRQLEAIRRAFHHEGGK